MTKSWDEVQENPSALPEAGCALCPSHDAQEHLMHGWGWAAWWKAPHMMFRRFCLAFCRAEPTVGRDWRTSLLISHLCLWQNQITQFTKRKKKGI